MVDTSEEKNYFEILLLRRACSKPTLPPGNSPDVIILVSIFFLFVIIHKRVDIRPTPRY